MHAPVHMELQCCRIKLIEMPHLSSMPPTHSRCWSVTHRPWTACLRGCAYMWRVCWWGGGQDSWGREAFWISRQEESVWDEAQLWDRQTTGSYQMHTHTHTHAHTNTLPPLHFPGQHPLSLTATHVLRYMWVLLMKMLGEFLLLPLFLIMSNKNVWQKHIKTYMLMHNFTCRYVTQLLRDCSLEIIRNRLNAVCSPCHLSL